MRKQHDEKKLGAEQGKRPSRSGKSSSTVASRVRSVVQLLIEEGSAPQPTARVTFFTHQTLQQEIISNMLEELRKENPQLYSSQDRLLGAVEECYRRLNSST